MAVNRISELDALPLHDDIIIKDTTENVERLNDKFRKSWFEISYFNKEDNELPSYYLSRKLYIEDVLSAASNYFISVLSDPNTILSNLKVYNLSMWGSIDVGKPDTEHPLTCNSITKAHNFCADPDTIFNVYGETIFNNRIVQHSDTYFDSGVVFRKDPEKNNVSEYRSSSTGSPAFYGPHRNCATFFGRVAFFTSHDLEDDRSTLKSTAKPAIFYDPEVKSRYTDASLDGVDSYGVLSVQNVIIGCCQSALWADLAENYEADAKYEPGTLIQFGGEKEITIATTDVNAVVSSNPAYVMNHKENENYLPIALTGRVPVKIIGKINKFDNIVLSGIPGIAKAQEDVTEIVIGKALTTNDSSEIKLVECVIKLTL